MSYVSDDWIELTRPPQSDDFTDKSEHRPIRATAGEYQMHTGAENASMEGAPTRDDRLGAEGFARGGQWGAPSSFQVIAEYKYDGRQSGMNHSR
jgi:hypothetical protein